MKVGDVVMCVDNANFSVVGITIGKEYKITKVGKGVLLWVINDDGEENMYMERRFSKKDRRKIIINSL